MKRLLPIAAFTTGFAVMGTEMTAGRLLAPSFGTSSLVWSALIAVVLVALAAGAHLGGRWSRRPRALAEAFIAVTIAGFILALVPTLARPLMHATLTDFMHGKLAVVGLSFAGVLTLLVVPIVLLGATNPIFVHCAAKTSDVGRAAGGLSSAGTLGSLVGTLACGLVLVPLAGIELTFRSCGLVAVLLGAFGLGKRALVLVPAYALVFFLPRTAAIETTYNHVTVVDDAAYRKLYFNEGYAAQTILPRDGSSYLRGVWGYYALAPTFTTRPPKRVLVLGLGGGGSARDYARRLDAEVVAVELDPKVAAIAKTKFDLPASVEVHTEDARTFLARDARGYDLVVVDAFQFPYVPFQLTTREFFADVARHLNPGGAVMMNVGRKGSGLDVVDAVASTLHAVFPRVAGVNVPQATNTILVASFDAATNTDIAFTASERRELVGLPSPAPWPDRGAVLTDDRAPVEWLTHRVILRELARMVAS